MPRIRKSKEIIYYIQDFIDYCRYKELSTKTIKSYYQTLTLFSKYLEEEKEIFNVNDVNKEIVEEYIQFTKDRGKYSYVADEKSLNKTYQNNRRDIDKEILKSTLSKYKIISINNILFYI